MLILEIYRIYRYCHNNAFYVNTFKNIAPCSLSNVSLYDLCPIIIYNGSDSRLTLGYERRRYKITPSIIGWAQAYYFAYYSREKALINQGCYGGWIETGHICAYILFSVAKYNCALCFDYWTFAQMPV